ncbi:SfnB family sulfur acquisition oxidoreductase, partial [Acinetobacter baumannii]
MTSYQSVQTKQTSASGQAHIIQNDAEALEIAKQFAEQFKKTSVERDSKRILPYTEIDALSQSGLWAITVPKQYGGAEVSSHTVAKVIALLSGADGSIGQIPQNHFYALEVLRNTGTEAQKQRLYGEVLNGTRFGNALAEFKTKTSTHKQTNIRPHENGYLIQGEKFYCTGSLFAHRIPTLVLDDAGREYLAFVKSGSQGLKLVDDWSGFG